MNTKCKKGIVNTIIFLFFISLTFFVIFKEDNVGEIFKIIQKVDIKFIAIAILCMCCFILSEGINIARTLKLLGCKVNFINSIKYALVGFFFSSVTPSASGGDPMQLYYMKKDGLPIGHSALALLTEFSSFQFVTVIIALIGFIINYNFIQNSVGNIKYLLLIGVAINVAILAIILLTIFSNKIIHILLNLVCKILEKLHYRKVASFKEKCLEQIQEYKAGSKLLKRNKKILAKIILTTIVQIVLYHSIPYIIYLSFGLNEANFLQFLSLQAVLYISVSSIPLPGAVGASEIRFYEYL